MTLKLIYRPQQSLYMFRQSQVSDYQPYLFKTEDGGKFEEYYRRSSRKNAYMRIVQDHVNPNLLFWVLNMEFTSA